jgi:hypothetical protein
MTLPLFIDTAEDPIPSPEEFLQKGALTSRIKQLAIQKYILQIEALYNDDTATLQGGLMHYGGQYYPAFEWLDRTDKGGVVTHLIKSPLDESDGQCAALVKLGFYDDEDGYLFGTSMVFIDTLFEHTGPEMDDPFLALTKEGFQAAAHAAYDHCFGVGAFHSWQSLRQARHLGDVIDPPSILVSRPIRL